jgi:thioredoxin 1
MIGTLMDRGEELMAQKIRMIFNRMVFVCWVCWTIAPVFAGDLQTAGIPPVPTPGMATLLDLGSHKCIPCKMMEPVLKDLRKEYDGRASVIFIDVWEHRDQAQRFGIRAIPTQIFYDRQGREVSRHMGFLDKQSIISVFQKLGVPSEAGR